MLAALPARHRSAVLAAAWASGPNASLATAARAEAAACKGKAFAAALFHGPTSEPGNDGRATEGAISDPVVSMAARAAARDAIKSTVEAPGLREWRAAHGPELHAALAAAKAEGARAWECLHGGDPARAAAAAVAVLDASHGNKHGDKDVVRALNAAPGFSPPRVDLAVHAGGDVRLDLLCHWLKAAGGTSDGGDFDGLVGAERARRFAAAANASGLCVLGGGGGGVCLECVTGQDVALCVAAGLTVGVLPPSAAASGDAEPLEHSLAALAATGAGVRNGRAWAAQHRSEVAAEKARRWEVAVATLFTGLLSSAAAVASPPAAPIAPPPPPPPDAVKLSAGGLKSTLAAVNKQATDDHRNKRGSLLEDIHAAAALRCRGGVEAATSSLRAVHVQLAADGTVACEGTSAVDPVEVAVDMQLGLAPMLRPAAVSVSAGESSRGRLELARAVFESFASTTALQAYRAAFEAERAADIAVAKARRWEVTAAARHAAKELGKGDGDGAAEKPPTPLVPKALPPPLPRGRRVSTLSTAASHFRGPTRLWPAPPPPPQPAWSTRPKSSPPPPPVPPPQLGPHTHAAFVTAVILAEQQESQHATVASTVAAPTVAAAVAAAAEAGDKAPFWLGLGSGCALSINGRLAVEAAADVDAEADCRPLSPAEGACLVAWRAEGRNGELVRRELARRWVALHAAPSDHAGAAQAAAQVAAEAAEEMALTAAALGALALCEAAAVSAGVEACVEALAAEETQASGHARLGPAAKAYLAAFLGACGPAVSASQARRWEALHPSYGPGSGPEAAARAALTVECGGEGGGAASEAAWERAWRARGGNGALVEALKARTFSALAKSHAASSRGGTNSFGAEVRAALDLSEGLALDADPALLAAFAPAPSTALVEACERAWRAGCTAATVDQATEAAAAARSAARAAAFAADLLGAVSAAVAASDTVALPSAVQVSTEVSTAWRGAAEAAAQDAALAAAAAEAAHGAPPRDDGEGFARVGLAVALASSLAPWDACCVEAHAAIAVSASPSAGVGRERLARARAWAALHPTLFARAQLIAAWADEHGLAARLRGGGAATEPPQSMPPLPAEAELAAWNAKRLPQWKCCSCGEHFKTPTLLFSHQGFKGHFNRR